MNWSKFLLIIQMAPMIISLVQQVEATITGHGKGPEKLNLVLDTVGAAAQAVPVDELAPDDLKAAATSIVNTTVQRLNTAGVFKK